MKETHRKPLSDLTNKPTPHFPEEPQIPSRFYEDISPKIRTYCILDPCNSGVKVISKILHLDVIRSLLNSIMRKIDSTRKLVPEYWLKARINKKLAACKRKYSKQVYYFFQHFMHYYHHYNVNPRTKVPNRPESHQLNGIYEDVNTYSKFW
jgi:hypothetical protein